MNHENFTDHSTDPFTPCETAAPNPRIYRAMNARLELLLLRHHPTFFPAWVASMEAKGLGRNVNLYWGQTLAYIAALLPVDARFGGEGADLTPFEERRMERNLTLLIRLVLTGCRRRGEFLTPEQREARLAAQEALYREQHGDAAYHRMIEQNRLIEGTASQEDADRKAA